jgi:ureidoglycolate dehydrogenase (NAD+)
MKEMRMSDMKTRLLNSHIQADQLHSCLLEAMRIRGMRPEDARVTADVLVTTDTWGVFTHGSKQLRPLLKLSPDRMDLKAVPEVIAEGPAWALVDGHYAMAMVTSCMAMEKAIAKARSSGFGFAGVMNSNHFGGAGYYAVMAAQRDMIGIAMTNTNPLVVVPGGRTAVLGTNPFSYAVPAGNGKPIFLDIATSVVAGSKPISARSLGQEIPPGWLVDRDGLPTTDPSHYPEEGALLPMAGHKGYGIALLIEILSAALTGADTLSGVKLWLEDHPGPLNQGHCFIAMDVNALMPIQRFKERVDSICREIQEAPKAKGSARIYLPGEIEWEKRERALAEGMRLPEHVVDRLIGLSEDVGFPLEPFFPGP